MTVLVIDLSFFWIFQDAVSLGSFLELIFGLFISGVFVGMVFKSFLPVGFF